MGTEGDQTETVSVSEQEESTAKPDSEMPETEDGTTQTEVGTTVKPETVSETEGSTEQQGTEATGAEDGTTQIQVVTTVKPDPDSGLILKCVINGVEYNDFERIPNEDPCKLCFCQYGIELCSVKECPKPAQAENCVPLPPPEGECCPTEYSCGK